MNGARMRAVDQGQDSVSGALAIEVLVVTVAGESVAGIETRRSPTMIAIRPSDPTMPWPQVGEAALVSTTDGGWLVGTVAADRGVEGDEVVVHLVVDRPMR